MIIIAALLAATVPEPRQTNGVDLLSGNPVHTILKGVRLDYDGKSLFKVRARGRVLRFRALDPASVIISGNGRYLVHNFGNGSGQIYDLRVFTLPTGQPISVRPFKERVLRFAHDRKSCSARMDEISFVVERWRSPAALQIGTEDWTRRPGCGHLFRKWIFRPS
jgi:hypothetical protein